MAFLSGVRRTVGGARNGRRRWVSPTHGLWRLCLCALEQPTPVLAAIVEYQGKVLLARNAAWQEPVFALITGFMEAGETPEEGVKREIAEETNLHTTALELVAVHDYQRMNQVIISYHAVCEGEVRLSPELAEYRLFALDEVKCWPAGTGWALAQWLRARGVEPQWRELRKA